MIRTIALISWAFAATIASAQEAETPDVLALWEVDRSIAFDATALEIEDFVWQARPVVVFADSPNDPRFREQLELLAQDAEDLAERDVIILIDTDPGANGPLRRAYRPRGFNIVLIGKDGEIELRKPSPQTGREISRSIDKMPLRRQEVEDRRLSQ